MSVEDSNQTWPWPRWAGPALLVVTGAACLAWTWRAWPDPLIDFGRELYVPWRLAEGDALFTDIAWFNGPLSQYWNALLFRAFGPGLMVLVWSNVLVLAASVCMLYALIARLADRLTAAAAGMVFLLVFAFGQYVGIANYNWITPYAHELTHGIALALATLVALERWSRTGSKVAAALGGLALGLCFLTKAEPFLAGAVASLVALASAAKTRDLRTLGAFVGAALVPVAASLLLVGLAGTLGAWPSVLAGDVGKLAFYRAGMGLDDPALRVAEILTWTGVWILALALALAVSWLGRETRGPVLPLASAAASFLVLAAWGDSASWMDALRPLPLAVAAVAAGLLAALWRGRGDGRTLPALAFAALAFVLLLKMLLRTRVAHYGFALAMPASLLVVTALVGWVPSFLSGRGLRGDVFRACALALVAFFAAEHVSRTHAWLGLKTEVVGEGRDAFRSDVRGVFVNEAVSYLATSGARSAAVLPEGVVINYLARVPNPTPYLNFMPPEEILFGDEAWTAAFRRAPPDLILRVPKDTSEYGRGPFGIGYGRALAAWVASAYVTDDVIRAADLPFEIRILRRR